ncbi:MAG: hypothetical protein QOC80_61 [Frankiaceae bacterium]|nr:hypothetical protein [Frankiaceae bacterium]
MDALGRHSGSVPTEVQRAVRIVPAVDDDPNTTAPVGSAPTVSESSLSRLAAPMLDHLQGIAPLAVWAFALIDGDDAVLEAVRGPVSPVSHTGGLGRGTRLRWSAMVCSRMIRGGPRAVPDLSRVADYAAAPLARRLPIGAYVGVPVSLPDGTVIGSLFGIDPSAQTIDLRTALPVAQIFSGVLAAAVQTEAALEDACRRAADAERRAVTDGLTGITNRAGWEEALGSEHARALRRGLWTGLVSLDLDDLKEINDRYGHPAGDALLVAAGECLQAVVRREDVLARVGGDEFAVLVSDCDPGCLDRLGARLREVLDAVEVRASIGAVSVPAGTGLRQAWSVADRQMYAEKHGGTHRQLDLDLTDAAVRAG